MNDKNTVNPNKLLGDSPVENRTNKIRKALCILTDINVTYGKEE